MYTSLDLKKQFGLLKIAKEHFNVKAQSWIKLCEKLNTVYAKDAEIVELKSLIKGLTQELEVFKVMKSSKSQLDILLLDLVYNRGVGSEEIFESPQATEGEPEDTKKDDWVSFYSVLNRRYHRLCKIYHPDCGGSEEQLRNLTHSYKSSLVYVKTNNGMNL